MLDTLELGHRDALLGAELVVGDIRDRALVTDLCRSHGVTQVVHFAAYKNVGESMEPPEKYWLNNVAGTVDLVEAMLAAEVRNIVFSSSCSVNGTPPSVPVTEDAPIAPESVYAESKAMVEKILGWYGVTNGLTAVNLRYFNAAGASEDSVDRRGLDAVAEPHPAGDEGHPRQASRRCRCSATTTPRPTARASATTSTSTTSPTPTSAPSTTSPRAGRPCRSTSAPASAAASSTSSAPPNGSVGPHGALRDRGPTCRRPGRRPSPIPLGINSVLGWTSTRSLDQIVDSAWRWHSTHLDGYGS